VSIVGVVISAVGVPPASAEESLTGRYEEVVLVPVDGSTITSGFRTYAGSLRVSGHDDGLALVEEVDPETYLTGIQEVPYSWHPEALKAQAVAARTYLAWTLRNGRTRSGFRYGYDICATDSCQVYGGIGLARSAFGSPWTAAVSSTAGEMLLHDQRPAQALYSSTTGGATRSVQDVFPGAAAVPYLSAVPSPNEESPFVEWTVRISERNLARLLRHGGIVTGDLIDIGVKTTEDGQGPWHVRVVSEGGTAVVSTWELRTIINRAAGELMPDEYPSLRPDGRRYPQTVLSPTYQIDTVHEFSGIELVEWFRIETIYEFEGKGWGHMVGLSQYGAQAMADQGVAYRNILSHYYQGLITASAPDLLPPTVAVGIAAAEPELVLKPDGWVEVFADGAKVAEGALGDWWFEAVEGELMVHAPAGVGLPPTLRDGAARTALRYHQSLLGGVTLTAPADVRITVVVGPASEVIRDWSPAAAGRIVFAWDGRRRGWDGRTVTVVVEAQSPYGRDRLDLTLVGGSD
jgi:stage II sporulation protein D